jgi:hypothetical protein
MKTGGAGAGAGTGTGAGGYNVRITQKTATCATTNTRSVAKEIVSMSLSSIRFVCSSSFIACKQTANAAKPHEPT